MLPRSIRLFRLLLPLCAGASAWSLAGAEEPTPLTLAGLQDSISVEGRAIRSFRVEGVVCATGGQRTLLALQDESATVLLEGPPFDAAIRAGDRVAVTGKDCAITRGKFGIQLGTTPVVEIDGRHPPITKSGRVFLEEGMQPLRVEWFNGDGIGSLKVEYEGPELPRQEIPASELWRRAEGAGDLQPGLDGKTYFGDEWLFLPDFSELGPVVSEVVATINVENRIREGNIGLVFTGYLRIPRAGIYTFHETSDDGSRVYAGDPVSRRKIQRLDGGPHLPVIKTLQQVIGAQEHDSWVAAEGRVTFAARRGSQLELELNDRGIPVSVTIAEAEEIEAETLLNQRIRVAGICQFARSLDQPLSPRIVVVGADRLEVFEPAAALKEGDLLTTAERIRRLQPDQARKPLRALLRGVVTMSTPGALVLQDATGGVYIAFSAADWVNQPGPGELWEIEGNTDPGDFSPMINAERGVSLGKGALPEPVRPTWEQLMNGSLDAEQVEIQGVIISNTVFEMTLLTRDGKVRINRHEYYPLAASPGERIGSVVRLRGVFTANWDNTTKRVKGGEFYLGNAMLSVEERAPADPFSIEPMRATDLLLFTSHAHALKRVRIVGQVLCSLPNEIFLNDGTIGLRVLTRDAVMVRPGDQVEAVGFPRLGGPSPLLLEAQARPTGSTPLPEAIEVSAGTLPDPRRDSTLVKIDGVLLSDTVRQEERLLEMQAGANRFVARLRGTQDEVKPIIRGSRLQLTGVYASAREDRVAGSRDPFELLLNQPSDIVMLRQGPWWTVRHTIAAIATLTGGLFIALMWVTLLRRKVAQRTAELAVEIEERQRVEQHRAMEQERTRVAQDLHDELGSGLTEAGILSSLVKNPAVSQDKKEVYLDQLSETCRSLVTGLDEIVWAVNPRYDSAADLAGYYSLFAQRFLNLAGIACRLEVAGSIPEHPLDARRRHGIFLAFKEALNNVVRHSHATEVQLAIGVDGGKLKISISDNGQGLGPAGDVPGKDGLLGMRQRMQNLGGDCRIDSRPGEGTTVEFSLPLEKNPS